MSPLNEVTLSDRYDRDGVVVLSGTQAIVRLLLEQRKRDAAAGRKTGGYVTGYRGSPLGGLDMELWAEADRLKRAGIVFSAGLNEDLAATAVWGTQQLNYTEDRTVDGVFALWYGKGPGVDRAGDALKHGNYAGASSSGGVVLVVGDDHSGKSSSIAHQSEQALVAAQIPVFYPSNVQEIVDFGLHAFALSRFSGVWTALKLVNETAETSATVEMRSSNAGDTAEPGSGFEPALNYNPLGEEIDLVRRRLPKVADFIRRNPVDRRMLGEAGARLGIVTAGKAYNDLVDALDLLGIGAMDMSALGISVFKIGLVYPLDKSGLQEFAAGCRELFFVEEKRPFLETQAAAALYDLDDRPAIVGKVDPADPSVEILPTAEALDATIVASALLARMAAHGLTTPELERRRQALAQASEPAPADLARIPHFCSGCPHSTSTVVPQGSHAFSGIGCHGMASWIDPRTLKGVHMGGEGANWIGLSHFTTKKHVFQNMGDGTFAHSGLLAIRAAVHARVNITYKILANSAVAMTGGQPVEGEIGTLDIVRQVLAEGVSRCVIVAEDPARFDQGAPVEIFPRDALGRVQRELRDVPGTTVLVYDQMCATEKRRQRKRGKRPKADVRVFINDAVCEACGDCSAQSNCISIVPVQTAFGPKRMIDQSACNQDLSCLKGFCPSFVTIEGGELRKPEMLELGGDSDVADVAVAPLDREINILITGIGGAGVVTVGAVLIMAARIAGINASTFNMTGLAQKGGAVTSHIRLRAADQKVATGRIPAGQADLLIASDFITASSKEALAVMSPRRTFVVGDSHVQPTSAIIARRDQEFAADPFVARLRDEVEAIRPVSATELSQLYLGDKMGANMLLVGYAYQMGRLPIPLGALKRAIEMNGAAVKMNLAALDLGRKLAGDPAAYGLPATVKPLHLMKLPDLIDHRAGHLQAYQDAAWARRYRARVGAIARKEREVSPESDMLTRTVAINLAKLMSYKDEYEVARLFSSASWKDVLARTYVRPGRLAAHLAPPFMPAGGESERPSKRRFGGWIFRLYPVLAEFRRLRGTAFDPFGYAHERRMERALIERYMAALDDIECRLTRQNLAEAVRLARIADMIRGYGPVKAQSMRDADRAWSDAVCQFHAATAATATAAPEKEVEPVG